MISMYGTLNMRCTEKENALHETLCICNVKVVHFSKYLQYPWQDDMPFKKKKHIKVMYKNQFNQLSYHRFF